MHLLYLSSNSFIVYQHSQHPHDRLVLTIQNDIFDISRPTLDLFTIFKVQGSGKFDIFKKLEKYQNLDRSERVGESQEMCLFSNVFKAVKIVRFPWHLLDRAGENMVLLRPGPVTNYRFHPKGPGKLVNDGIENVYESCCFVFFCF